MTEHLNDNLTLSLPGDNRIFTVAQLRTLGYTDGEIGVLVDATPELRTTEGRRHSATDQSHLDAAHAAAGEVLDHLASAGARVPGTSQRTEADVEKAERAAGRFAPPDAYEPQLKQLRAACATPDSTFEEKWKADRLRELNAEHARLEASSATHRAAMSRAAEGRTTYPIPNSYEADLQKLRERDARALAAKESHR